MRPKVKTARRKASKLHGAQAGYVSIVDRGAAETPFTLIKSANGVTAMPVKKRGKPVTAVKSHKKIPAATKKADAPFRTETMMAKMVFSADVFGDEQEVRDWITEAEWEADSIDIVQNDAGDFEARPNDLGDDDFERIAEVDVDEEGVSGFVGERKIFEEDDDPRVAANDEADEDEEEVEGDEEEIAAAADEVEEVEASSDDKDDEEKMGNKKKPKYSKADDGTDNEPKKFSKRQEFLAKRKAKAQKFDAWDAMFSEGNTIAKVLSDGTDWDGIPPGVAEVNLAFSTAIGNILGSDGMPATDKQEALNKAAMDFAEIVGGLDTFFSEYTEDTEEVEARFPVEKRTKVAKWAEHFADWLSQSDPDNEEVSDDDDAEKAEKKSVKVASADVATIDYSKVADLVAKAVEPLSERVDAVSGTVESLASRRPSKKAVASDDSGNAAPAQSKETKADDDDPNKWAARKQVKGLFG